MKSGLLLFSLLLIVSFSSRLLFLDSIPEGMHRDEISVGYNAYSIAKTAKDEYGRFLPFLFEALGDFKLPVVVYATVPTVLLFGLDDYWVRFPTAFLGALTPIALFFFTFTLTRNKTLSFLSAFLLTISPQHILFSRSVNESTISVFLIIVAMTFLLKLFNNWKFSYLTLTVLFFTLSIFTYRTQFIFTPLIITSAIVIYSKYWKKWSERQIIFSFLTLLLFVATFLIVILNTSTTRIRDVNLFNDGDLKQALAIQIREDGFAKPIVTRILHNKLWNYSIGFSQNYVSHFDPTYLFFTGDKLSSINSTPWMGHLLFIDLPFFMVGIMAILKMKKISRVAIILAWLIIGPIASAFTADSPSALRNLVSTPAYAIIIGLGILLIINAVKQQALRLTFIVLLTTFYLANIFYFVHLFTTHKRIHEPWYRDVGLQAMVSETQKIEVNYQKVIFADYPALYAFLLYYKNIDPSIIQDINFEDNYRERPQKLVNIINPKYHIMSEVCLNQGKAGFLYVCREHRVPHSSKIVKSIRYADMLPAFTFLEFPQSHDGIKSGEILPTRYEYLKGDEIKNMTIIPEIISK